MDQGVRYVVTLESGSVTRGLKEMEQQALQAEGGVRSLNASLREMADVAALSLIANQIISFGKDAVQGAADYEVAMMRIKNVSKSTAEGLANISFINSEVDKLKIPLQDAADAYGTFLVRIANSGLAGDQVRKLHDEILSIAKVTGATPGKMDAAVLDIGKMLAEGVLEARTLRQLERVFPQITPFIAKDLGLGAHVLDKITSDKTEESTATQLLSRMESSGKLTKAAINSKVLLQSIDEYYDTIKEKIPESTKTIQSQINELGNDWVRFKNDLVFDNITELRELFDTLKSGIKYLKDNEDTIIKFGKAFLSLGKIYLEYRATMLLVNAAQATYYGFMAGFVGEETTAVTATGLRTAAISEQVIAVNALTAALERQMAIQAGGSGLVGFGGMAAGAATASGKASITGAGGAVGSFIRGVPAVVIAYFAADALAQLGENKSKDGYAFNWWNNLGFATSPFETGKKATLADIQAMVNQSGSKDVYKNITGSDFYKSMRSSGIRNVFDSLVPFDSKTGVQNTSDSAMVNMLQQQGVVFKDLQKKQRDDDFNSRFNTTSYSGTLGFLGLEKYALKNEESTTKNKESTTGKKFSDSDKIIAPNDKVTGQRVITYNINIKEIIGIKDNIVQEGGKMDTDRVALVLRDVILGVVNDSQLRSGE